MTSKRKPLRKPRLEPGLFPDDIPPKLASPAFLDVWGEYRQHRKEIHHRLTPTSERRLLRKLASYPIDVAVKMVEQSIENGWQGIFELRTAIVRDNAPAPVKRSTYFCPMCNRQHPVSHPCVTSSPASDERVAAVVDDLAARFRMTPPNVHPIKKARAS